MAVCVACNNREGGCERCRGGPGEQGFSLDEKELLDLRDQLRAVKAERDEAIADATLGHGTHCVCRWCSRRRTLEAA